MKYSQQLSNLKTPKTKVSSSNGQVEERPILIRDIPIMWGIPCDEVMFSKFFTMFMKNAGVMPWDSFATTESTYLPDARNTIHNAFLDKSDMQYLMMIDSDILFPPDVAYKLLAHKKPIVAGWYKNKRWMAESHPIVYDFVSETDSLNYRHRDVMGDGLERVDAVGAGCILMSREVAEKLGKSPYDMNKGGEDMKLCRKLQLLEIPLFVDWNMACAHLRVDYV
jgi:hypothetical protein